MNALRNIKDRKRELAEGLAKDDGVVVIVNNILAIGQKAATEGVNDATVEVGNAIIKIGDKLPALVGSIIATVMYRKQQVQSLMGIIEGYLDEPLSWSSRLFYLVDTILREVAKHRFIITEAYANGLFFCPCADFKEVFEGRGYELPTELPQLATRGKAMRGGRVSSHDKHLNLAHLERMNNVGMFIDEEVLTMVAPEFDEEPRLVKGTSRLEEPHEIEQRRSNWVRLYSQLPERVAALGATASEGFYLRHSYDNGGRFYPVAFHFNYQSEKYLRAVIGATSGDIVKPEW